jgi:histidine triad (HIT) family protein
MRAAHFIDRVYLMGYTLDMKDCVFCKIIRGDLPSSKVYEDDRTLAFLDIHPVSKGHTLVIPKNNSVRNIFDISADDWVAMTAVVHTLASAIERAMSADGVNIMMNNREYAGQVVDHPHIHIIPRFKGDGLSHWKHGSYKDGEVAEVLKKIHAEIR